jgi:hypothetical protein
VDEDYWDRYRTTPKAFVALEVAQRLWGSRYGSLTSVRLGTLPNEPMATAVERITRSLDVMVDPETFGLALRDIRTEGLAASRGATDFGEYFVYFSFFIVVSALVLVVLFFKLGIEQRAKEVGLLRAVGLSPRSIRRLFTAEGLLLALLGSLIGMGAAVGYAWLLMRALTTWWVDSVGTTALTLHLSSLSLATGAAVGVVAAVICIWWTLRALGRVSERTLLAGEVATAMDDRLPSRSRQLSAVAMTGMGVALAVLATLGVMPEAGGFFGAGAVLLVAALTFASLALRRPARHPIAGHGWLSVSHLATRYASHRPGRSVLSMAVIASATFILVTVDAFRRDAHVDGSDRHSGTGGYELMVQTLLPIVYDPNSETGRDSLNLGSLDRSTTIEPFRVRPGDDASCLNLYQPTNPRIVAPRDSFLTEGRFTFRRVATGRDEERADPWLLLNRVEPDGAIPVIADANSMTYVLHKAVGDDLAISARGRPVTLRFVGALSDSIFQSEVLMSERNFVRLFPEQDGFQLLLVDTSANAGDVANAIEQGMSDAGGDAVPGRRVSRVVSPRREHLLVHVPGAGRARSPARHGRSGDGPPQKRARAAARAGSACRGRLPAVALSRDGGGREPPDRVRRTRGRRGVCGDRHRARGRRPRGPSPALGRRAAAAVFGARRCHALVSDGHGGGREIAAPGVSAIGLSLRRHARRQEGSSAGNQPCVYRVSGDRARRTAVCGADRPGTGGERRRADGRRRGRSGALLGPLARSLRAGVGQRCRLSRPLVRDREHPLEDVRSRRGKLVADRVARSHLPDDGA